MDWVQLYTVALAGFLATKIVTDCAGRVIIFVLVASTIPFLRVCGG